MSKLSASLPARARRLLSLLRMYLGTNPHLFYKIYGGTSLTRELRVRPDTHLVIEGFPRSANTFAVLAFNQAQEEPLKIAHHLHVPAQLQLGARLKIPVMFLIRKPAAAIISLVVLEPWRSLEGTIREYILFHQAVLKLPRESFVLGQFEQVTTDFGEVIEEANRQFNCRFKPFQHTPANVSGVLQSMDALLRQFQGAPEHAVGHSIQAEKALSDRLLRQMNRTRIRPLLDQAEALHRRIVQADRRKISESSWAE